MKKIILPKDSNFNLLVEKEHFIIDRDELYCVRDSCEDCRYVDSCEKLEKDSDTFLENYINKATRDNIRLGKIKTKEWVTVTPKPENLKYYKLKNRQFYIEDFEDVPKEVKKDCYLALNNKVVYKKIDKEIVDTKEDFVLYSEEERAYFCIKACRGCKYEKICNPEMVEVDSEKVYVAIDSSSQEPTIISFLSKEPNYISIFRNNSIKDMPYIYEPISWLLEDVMKIDPENHKGASFIDYIGFEDKTILYKLAKVFYENIGDNLNKEEINKIVDEVKKLYKKFK